MSFREVAIWQDRFDALSNVIVEAFNSFDEQPSQEWEVIVKGTLKRLLGFSKKQFDFFKLGFTEGKLIDSPKFKAEYAVRRTLDQIAYDLEVLQRARNQRLSNSEKEIKALELADKLAYKALEPVVKGGLLEQTAVITYFQKTADVRVIPYAPVALIGIPYSCVDIENNARDFLAIPHEIGHYVYWHAKDPGSSIRLEALLYSKIPQEPMWRTAWLEEIFADVYGTLVAGVVIALDFQEYLYDNLDLTEDDGVHPVSAIRPKLYTNVLRRLKGAKKPFLFSTSPKKLDDGWDDLLEKKRDNPKQFTPHNRHHSAEPVLFHKANTKISEVVFTILKLLDSALPAKTKVGVWSSDTDSPSPTLYKSFHDDILNPLIAENVPELSLQWQAWGQGKIDPDEPAVRIEPTNDDSALIKWLNIFDYARLTGLSLLPETWNTLLNGTGWAVGGPEGPGNPI